MYVSDKMYKDFLELIEAANAVVDDASVPDLVNGIGCFVGGEVMARLRSAIASYRNTTVGGFTLIANGEMAANQAYVIMNGKLVGSLEKLFTKPSGEIEALVQAPPKPLEHIDVQIVIGDENANT